MEAGTLPKNLFYDMMLLLQMLGGDKLTYEFSNGLNQKPCMEAGTLPKKQTYKVSKVHSYRVSGLQLQSYKVT